MIISDRFGFLFVANLRTASTSIHHALGEVGSLVWNATSGAKHATLADVHELLGARRIQHLYKWAVIRDPVAYLWSMYEFHKADAFDGKPHSTKGKTFEEFYRGEAHGWMRVPQSSRFLGPGGDYGLDFLITMDRLAEGFGYVKSRLGLPNVLLLVTNATVQPPDVPDALQGRIRDEYADDYACIARYGNRERTADGFHLILQPSQPAGAG